MISRTLLATVLVSLTLVGCAARPSIPVWTPELAEAVRSAAEADPSIAASERWLFESGLASAHPGTAEYDPERARERLGELLARYPDTRYRDLVSYLLPLLEENVRERRERSLLHENVQRVQLEVELLEARVRGLNQLLDDAESRDDRYRETIASLQATIERRNGELRELQEKLDALMRVDLEADP